MKLLNYIRFSFTKCIDFKSKVNRFEFFTGLITSSLFLLLNIFIVIQLNTYLAHLRSDALSLISLIYVFIAVLFTFIQCHSLIARRLNDIKVNPFFALLPFLLGSAYVTLKIFINTEIYGKFIFLAILTIIVISITLLLSDSD